MNFIIEVVVIDRFHCNQLSHSVIANIRHILTPLLSLPYYPLDKSGSLSSPQGNDYYRSFECLHNKTCTECKNDLFIIIYTKSWDNVIGDELSYMTIYHDQIQHILIREFWCHLGHWILSLIWQHINRIGWMSHVHGIFLRKDFRWTIIPQWLQKLLSLISASRHATSKLGLLKHVLWHCNELCIALD